MIGLLKAFGKGILYVIGAPFFVVALVLFGAIGLLAFIFQIFKSIIFFFTGQKFFPELPEDKELRLKREAATRKDEPVQEDKSTDFSNIISVFFRFSKLTTLPANNGSFISFSSIYIPLF